MGIFVADNDFTPDNPRKEFLISQKLAAELSNLAGLRGRTAHVAASLRDAVFGNVWPRRQAHLP